MNESEWVFYDTAEPIQTLDASYRCDGKSIVVEDLVLERQPDGRRLVVDWKILKIKCEKSLKALLIRSASNWSSLPSN